MSKHLAVAAFFGGMVLTAVAQTQTVSAAHTIAVNFNYNFKLTPPCSAKANKNCVQQFNVYDISAGAAHRIKLFSVPVPAGASGTVNGITGTSPRLVFETGKHFLGVTAQTPSGAESDPAACQTVVEINP